MSLPRYEADEKGSPNGLFEQPEHQRRSSLSRGGRTPRKLFYVLLNTVSTIIVVFLNKVTFSDPQLRNIQVTIAIWHFLTTFVILLIASFGPFRAFKPIRLPITQMLPICAFFTLFLVLNNLSLTTNTVGFYQLAKILTTPALVSLDYLLFGRTVSWVRLACVAVSCVGVGLANGASARSNPQGAVIAVAAFVVTALYQIWIGKKIRDLKVSASQLLLNQAPVSILMLLPLVPFLDKMPDLELVPRNAILAFVWSGLVASMINLSQFLIIEGTSALTFNIVGMVKTIAIVSIGWWGEGKYLSIRDIFGVVLALGGAWVYAQTGAVGR